MLAIATKASEFEVLENDFSFDADQAFNGISQDGLVGFGGASSHDSFGGGLGGSDSFIGLIDPEFDFFGALAERTLAASRQPVSNHDGNGDHIAPSPSEDDS